MKGVKPSISELQKMTALESSLKKYHFKIYGSFSEYNQSNHRLHALFLIFNLFHSPFL